MSPLFTINFRREAYQRQLARVRQRVMILGVWVAYFGVLVVVMGLYGLNCVALQSRVGQIERQMRALRDDSSARQGWRPGQAELREIERSIESTRLWRDRIVRLPDLQPPTVRLLSLAVNPQNLSNPADLNKLVITGEHRTGQGQDRMRAVVQFTNALQRDSTFAAGYQNIRLVSTRSSEGPDGVTEFVIECR